MRHRTFVAISIPLVGTLLQLAPATAEAQGRWGGQVPRPNSPQTGLFGPGSPRDSRGAPAVDFTLPMVPGQYRIDLFSADTHSFDPYLHLYQNGREIARDDDGGSGLNSRIVRALHPGIHVVRVSRFGHGCGGGLAGVCRPVPFSLSAVREG